MKTNGTTIWLVLAFFLAACQPAAATPVPTSAAQKEIQGTATTDANQTSMAVVEPTEKTTLTATAPLPSDTPEATPTPNAFHFSLPASGCWMNSEIAVREDQTVIIRASGETNTWDGRQGSSSNPNGQTGVCGAIQCPLQGAGYGALIGRLDDLPPFCVGTMLRFTAAKDGQLYFTVNDWQCDDNSGNFDILITFP
jgi:hypothetical protein